MSRRLAAMFGAVAAVANCSFLLAPAVGSRLPWGTSMVSELSVAGQPAARLFRVGDGVAGVAALVAGVLLLGRRRTQALALAVFGAGTAVSAFLPLSCAPSADPACTSADAAAVDVLHDGVSVAATAAALVGAVLLTRATGGCVRVLTALLAGGVALLGVAQASFLVQHLAVAPGWAQRAQVLLVSAWLVVAPSVTRSRTAAAQSIPRFRG